MHVVRTWNACVTGTYAKAWLIEHFTMACNAAADCLRLEVLELWNLGTLIDSARGDLVFLENAAEVFVTSKWMPINLLAMFVKGDQKIRWFYSVISMASLFRWLDHDGLLEETTKKMNTTTAKGKRLYKFMQEYFLKAMQIPHHPDFSAAERLTDYAQHIFSPETAQRRLEACLEYHDLQPRNIPDIDPNTDRYSQNAHRTELAIACDAGLRWSAYLLLKRKFFAQFYKECVAYKERIGDGKKRVRTENAHQGWLERTEKWKGQRARKLVVGWKVLWFLEETGWLEWVESWGDQ